MTRLLQQPNLISRRFSCSTNINSLYQLAFLLPVTFNNNLKQYCSFHCNNVSWKAPHLNRIVFLFVNLVTSQFYYITVAVTTYNH